MDTDGDGIPDKWEKSHGLDYQKYDSDEDPDHDLLTNLQEYKDNTNPLKKDSDGDGYSDGEEVKKGTDPLNPSSHPRSSLIWMYLLIIFSLSVLIGGGYYLYSTKGRGKPPPRAQRVRPVSSRRTVIHPVSRQIKPRMIMGKQGVKKTPQAAAPVRKEEDKTAESIDNLLSKVKGSPEEKKPIEKKAPEKKGEEWLSLNELKKKEEEKEKDKAFDSLMGGEKKNKGDKKK